MKVLAFGEILWDIIESEEHLGGAPFNFIAHTAQCGNQAYIVTRIGDDARGMKAFNRCKQHEVSSKYIQWDKVYPTGIVEVVLNDGQPDYTIVQNVAWDFIEFNDEVSQIAKENFDVFYYGSLAQRSPVSAATLTKIVATFSFQHIFFDVNLRKTGLNETVIKTSLGHCSILKINHEEVPVVANMLIGKALDNQEFCDCVKTLYNNIGQVIITAAEKGCYVHHKGEFFHVAGVPVTVCDAVGAGDSFSAAFLHVFVKTGDPQLAGRVANEVGAYVATCRGALPLYSPEIKHRLLES
jgi:fructokinase